MNVCWLAHAERISTGFLKRYELYKSVFYLLTYWLTYLLTQGHYYESETTGSWTRDFSIATTPPSRSKKS